jgi:hypothetical protein
MLLRTILAQSVCHNVIWRSRHQPCSSSPPLVPWNRWDLRKGDCVVMCSCYIMNDGTRWPCRLPLTIAAISASCPWYRHMQRVSHLYRCADSPALPCTCLRHWLQKNSDHGRRAGVFAFGIFTRTGTRYKSEPVLIAAPAACIPLASQPALIVSTSIRPPPPTRPTPGWTST